MMCFSQFENETEIERKKERLLPLQPIVQYMHRKCQFQISCKVGVTISKPHWEKHVLPKKK